MPLKTDDFDYDLPEAFIAQTPVEPRDQSRLLVTDRATGDLRPARFFQLGEFLRPGDLLVLNETRVIPARVYARKVPSGGRVELLLLRRLDTLTWEALAGGKRVTPGLRLALEDGPQGVVAEALDGARRIVRFDAPIEAYLEQAGQMPLPPYIHTPLQNPERYQTVYARAPGSAAAPTAGLHFTPQLMESLQAQGVRFAGVTLHVGLDTFAPVTEDAPEEHRIHTEWCELDAAAAAAIVSTRQAGGRVIAVGTTSVRTLESAAQAAALDGRMVAPFRGPTGLYILPGYTFGLVDAMITNFHLPRSTLIMLVSAFAGRQRVLAAYEYAKQEGFRFYSFGDAMLIL
jgi:S-adenosylmethionine:tRNA ribosyltransferase-isomerase